MAGLTATAAAALLLAAIVGWVGYASTKQALRRSDRNVALSLEVFGELFDRLSPDEDFFPPPTGRRGTAAGVGGCRLSGGCRRAERARSVHRLRRDSTETPRSPDGPGSPRRLPVEPRRRFDRWTAGRYLRTAEVRIRSRPVAR